MKKIFVGLFCLSAISAFAITVVSVPHVTVAPVRVAPPPVRVAPVVQPRPTVPPPTSVPIVHPVAPPIFVPHVSAPVSQKCADKENKCR